MSARNKTDMNDGDTASSDVLLWQILKAQNEALTKQLAARDRQIAAMQDDAKALHKQLEARDAQIAQLSGALSTLTSSFGTDGAQIAKILRRLTTIEQGVTALQNGKVPSPVPPLRLDGSASRNGDGSPNPSPRGTQTGSRPSTPHIEIQLADSPFTTSNSNVSLKRSSFRKSIGKASPVISNNNTSPRGVTFNSSATPQALDSDSSDSESSSSSESESESEGEIEDEGITDLKNLAGGLDLVRLGRGSFYKATVTIHDMAQAGNIEGVQKILEMSSTEDPANQKDADGRTPLHIICTRCDIAANRLPIISLLIRAGTNVNAVDNNGWTPLHCACNQPDAELAEVINLLVTQGANASAITADGTRPLHFFVRQNPPVEQIQQFKKALGSLIKAGADINALNRDGESPVHVCVTYGSADVLILLVHNKVDLNQRTSKGETALHYATRFQNKELIETLLSLELDPRITDNSGQSAVSVAQSFGLVGKEIYDMLRGRMVSLDLAELPEDKRGPYRRRLAVEELIHTEIEYASDIDVLNRVFAQPIREAGIVTPMEFDALFGNIEEIRETSRVMRDAFKEALAETNGKAETACVGDIFLSHIQELGTYEKVCVHQQVAMDTLKRLMESPKDDWPSGQARSRVLNLTRGRKQAAQTPSRLAEFCSKASRLKECRLLDLASFLIKPFQRITKYPLLIREIQNFTNKSHPDFANLVQAKAAVDQLIARANEKKRSNENMQKIIQLQQSIAWPTEAMSTILVRSMRNREYLGDEKFTATINGGKPVKCTGTLTSDMFILTERQKDASADKKRAFVCKLPLKSTLLSDIKDGGKGEGGKPFKNTFRLLHTKKKFRVDVRASTNEDKLCWSRKIKAAIDRKMEGTDSPGSKSGTPRKSPKFSQSVRVKGERSRPSLLSHAQSVGQSQAQNDLTSFFGPGVPQRGGSGILGHNRTDSSEGDFMSAMSSSSSNKIPTRPARNRAGRMGINSSPEDVAAFATQSEDSIAEKPNKVELTPPTSTQATRSTSTPNLSSPSHDVPATLNTPQQQPTLSRKDSGVWSLFRRNNTSPTLAPINEISISAPTTPQKPLSLSSQPSTPTVSHHSNNTSNSNTPLSRSPATPIRGGFEVVIKYEAVHSFDADNDKMRLQPGDVVSVYEKDTDGKGWWYGKNETRGTTGYFPGAYVKEASLHS